MPSHLNSVVYGPEWVLRRQQGHRLPIGSNFAQMHQYVSSYDYNLLYSECKYGGIFNLEYSPNGSLLVAATERRALLFYDPYQQKHITSIPNAHYECINAVRFIDTNSFATCSDDCTIAIWDLRKLDGKVHHLCGHKNWVKSIEIVDNGLISSAFDGSILHWNLSESIARPSFKSIFKMNGLIRTRVSPDGTKLVISTASGYIIVIHNLDVDTLKQDLQDLQPNLYRLMQLCHTPISGVLSATNLFKTYGKRNRVEFITDFPLGNEAEVIASLAIFPDGCHILSRNTSHDETSEYTSVHSILETKEGEGEIAEDNRWPNEWHKTTKATIIIPPRQEREPSEDDDDYTVANDDVWEAMVSVQDARLSRNGFSPARPPRHVSFRPMPPSSSGQGASGSMRVEFEANESIRRINPLPAIEVTARPEHQDRVYERSTVEVTLRSFRDIRVQAHALQREANANPFVDADDPRSDNYGLLLLKTVRDDPRVHKNYKKLIGYIPEPNTGKGYIKEQAISKDGRFLISPFKSGVRVLSLSRNYQEPWLCDAKNYPQALTVVKELPAGPAQPGRASHVLCAQFSPLDKQVVAGTLNGKIVILNPLRE